MLIMGCMHHIKQINAEITKKAVYVYIFSYFSLKNALKLCGRNVGKQYEVANFFMKMRTTFRSKQFTAALGHPCHMSLEKFIAMAD